MMRGARIGVLLFALVAALLVVPPAQAEVIGVCGVQSSSAVPAPGSRISASPIPWATTDGYVQTGFRIVTPQGQALAIGGEFTQVIEPDGHAVPARNFAVIRVENGRMIYAGDANSNVRSIHAQWGKMYIAGKFTIVSGKSRAYVAQIDTATWQVTDWRPSPAPTGAQYVVTATPSDGVIFAGASRVRRVNIFNGSDTWAKNVAQGAVRSMQPGLDWSYLIIGGLFESYNGYVKHGAVSVNPATGVEDRSFGGNFRPDSGGPGSGQYDGDAILDQALSWSPQYGLLWHPAIGSAVFNTVRGMTPYAERQLWYAQTEGDAQAVASYGTTVVTGWHRNHGNGTACPWPYYGVQQDARTGTILTYWDPKLSGTQSSDGGEQNNGIHDIQTDGGIGMMFVLGAFTRYGAACDVTVAGYTPTCSGGTPLQSIAVYGLG